MIASIVSDKELVILIHNAYAYITRKKESKDEYLVFDTYGYSSKPLWMFEYSFIQFTNGKIFQ